MPQSPATAVPELQDSSKVRTAVIRKNMSISRKSKSLQILSQSSVQVTGVEFRIHTGRRKNRHDSPAGQKDDSGYEKSVRQEGCSSCRFQAGDAGLRVPKSNTKLR
jgi:hypothetical protein